VARHAKGDAAGALADYNRAIELDPASSNTYFNRALVWRERADWARAIADYDRDLALNPRHSDAYCNRGLTRLRQGAEAEAERDFASCLALNGNLKTYLEQRIRETKAQMMDEASTKK
jgi:tetratricopeptide (TPR) repeat protein